MSVSATNDAAPAIDRAEADRLFTELYAEYWSRIRYWLHRRFAIAGFSANPAEDAAQEVFILLLEKYILTGKLQDETASALIYAIAKNEYLGYFSRSSSKEAVLDFADPVNTPVVTTGHRYAAEQPELAPLAAELDAAMQVMYEASQKWRDLHKQVYASYWPLNDTESSPSAATCQKLERRLACDAKERDRALAHFRQTTAAVGNLRSELERAGGNWRSSTNMPAGLSKDYLRVGTVASDATRTHCPSGHEMHLENTRFDGEGRRRCRACLAVHTKKQNARNSSQGRLAAQRAEQARVRSEKLAAVRRMLADPAYLDTPVRQICAEVHIDYKVVRFQVRNSRQLRQTAREAASRLAEVAAR